MEETRMKLIQGARRCLIEMGHQEFSVRRAARFAGINHGMVHHLFGSKENLVLAVLAQELGEHSDETDDRSDEPAKALTAEETEQRRKYLNDHLMHDDGHIAILREMLSLAEDMPSVKQLMVDHLRARREQLSRRFGSGDEGPATLLLAAIMGLHFLRAIDPQLPVESAVDSLWQIGNKLVEEATRK